MFDPILVPLDGSQLAECALSPALTLARAFNSKVLLLRVLEQEQQHVSAPLFDLVNWQIQKSEAVQTLGKVETRLQTSGVQTEAVVQEGLVAESILEFAQSRGAKLIVLSSHGHSGISQWGMSSVALKIILRAPTSVLIVRAHYPANNEVIERAYQRILIPLDGSLRAENVLPILAHLARFHEAQVHIVRVVAMPEMARRMPPLQEDVDLCNRIVARNQEESIQYLEQIRLSSLLNGVAVQTHFLIADDVASALHGLVQQENIDLVALSAHGFTGNNQWPYGNTVNNFILYGGVPVLIVQDQPAKEDFIPADRSMTMSDILREQVER